MKNLRKNKLILFSLVVCLSIFVFLTGCTNKEVGALEDGPYITGVTDDGFHYSLVQNKYAMLSKYEGDATEVVVPDMIEGIKVEELSYTFASNKKIVSVQLPSTIKIIGENAFFNCKELREINIPDGVKTISQYAFRGCENLISINLPQSVKEIGTSAFAYCVSLTNINIPEGISVLSYGIFSNCTSLELITLPNSITEISSSAFFECAKLETINFPDNLKKIGNGAFVRCANLKEINLPQSISIIGDGAFSGTAITNIEWPIKKINDAVFSSCASLKSIVIPYGVTEIGSFAFSNCSSLEGVVIPDTVTRIGSAAFMNCASLTSISIPDSVTEIELQAFEDCTSLIDIELPKDIFNIQGSAFKNTAWLNKFENDDYFIVGNGVLLNMKLSEDATELIIPEGVKIIAFNMPYENQIRSITLPQSLENYGCIFGNLWVENIIVNDNNSYYSSLEGVLFNKNRTELLYYPLEKKDVTYVVPEGVIEFEFSGNPYLKNIVLPLSFEIDLNKAFPEESKREYLKCYNLNEDYDFNKLWENALLGHNNFCNINTIYFKHKKPDFSAGVEKAFKVTNKNLTIVWGYIEE